MPSSSSSASLFWRARRCLAALGLVGLGWGAASAQSIKPPSVRPPVAAKAQQGAVKVEGAWVRPAVKGQSATGGYMRLTASADLKLMGFSSPVAAEAQLHEMVMDGDVMQMREAGPLPLPAGTAVALQPGAGHQHLMLMGLKRPLKVGDEIKLVLKLQSAAGKALTQAVIVPVRSTAPASP